MNRREIVQAGAGALLAASSMRFFSEAAPINAPQPFRVNASSDVLSRIADRLARVNIPEPLISGTWSEGVDGEYLANLRKYWIDDFRWKEAETKLNRHPQYMAVVDGLSLDFYQVPGKVSLGSPPARPILILHGWPYSRFSLVDLIDRLTDPGRFGGDSSQAVTVVAPSLPGHGFSSKPKTALSPNSIASYYNKLMTEVLGYDTFGVQGGDHGHVIGTYLAHDFRQNVRGLHLNMIPTPPIPAAQQTPEIQKWISAKDAFIASAFSYFYLQADRPASIAYAMADSPVGLAAWFVDKYHAWTDLKTSQGNLDLALGNMSSPALGRERIVTELMCYLVSDSVASSIWFYNTFRRPDGSSFYPGGRIEVPTAAYLPQSEFINGRPPQALAQRFFNIVRYTTVEKGAHFPFWETPDSFAADITTFFHDVG